MYSVWVETSYADVPVLGPWEAAFDAQAFSTQTEEARQQMVGTYLEDGRAFGIGVDIYKGSLVDATDERSVWPLIKRDEQTGEEWLEVSKDETMILHPKVVAPGLVQILLNEEAARFELMEEQYALKTQATRSRQGMYKGGPLQRYEQDYDRLPSGMYHSSLEARTLFADINKTLDGRIEARRYPDEHEGIPVTRIVHAYLGGSMLSSQLAQERELLYATIADHTTS